MAPRKPKDGSNQFRPRVRSKKPYTVVKSWAKSKDAGLLGFAGYKVGMTHLIIKDNRPHSMTKGQNITWPATLIECPPLRLLSIRFYTHDAYGTYVAGEVMAQNIDKSVSRKLKLPKKYDAKKKLEEFENKLGEYTDVRIKVYTQPRKSGMHKKKPEIFEMGLGGDVKNKFEFAKGLLDKEIRVNEVLKAGIKVDTHSVTIGRGFQGVVKRFGVSLRSHKSEKKRRASILGAEGPRRIFPGVKMPGQLGYHSRTDYNKEILLVDTDVSKVKYNGGFKHYGEVKTDYIMVKGSVSGPTKRLIRFVMPIRGTKGYGDQIQVASIDLGGKK